jgi:hypothetical protein
MDGKGGCAMPRGRQQPRKFERAIANLLTAGSIEEAARRSEISERTLRVWMGQEAFAREYRAARRKILEHSIGLMQGASVSAVLALLRNLSCGKPGCEIAAANSLLERSTAGIELFDVLSRLEALEARAAQQSGASHAYNGTASNGEARGPGR